jgi:hypothetical protein
MDDKIIKARQAKITRAFGEFTPSNTAALLRALREYYAASDDTRRDMEGLLEIACELDPDAGRSSRR